VVEDGAGSVTVIVSGTTTEGFCGAKLSISAFIVIATYHLAQVFEAAHTYFPAYRRYQMRYDAPMPSTQSPDYRKARWNNHVSRERSLYDHRDILESPECSDVRLYWSDSYHHLLQGIGN
jgi:hypothetical protein